MELKEIEKSRSISPQFCIDSLIQRVRTLESESSKILDHLDLMVDEFERIKTLTESSEIVGLCDRAIATTKQKVPLIVQRDNLESALAKSEERVRELETAIDEHEAAMLDRQSFVMLGYHYIGKVNAELYNVRNEARRREKEV